ncbi:hypothetical protein LEMLEM_LOCUS3543 [Lemmus lemmus]
MALISIINRAQRTVNLGLRQHKVPSLPKRMVTDAHTSFLQCCSRPLYFWNLSVLLGHTHARICVTSEDNSKKLDFSCHQVHWHL